MYNQYPYSQWDNSVKGSLNYHTVLGTLYNLQLYITDTVNYKSHNCINIQVVTKIVSSDSSSSSSSSDSSDSDDDDSDSSGSSVENEKFCDGLDSDLIRDEEDRQHLESMTDVQRESELYKR